PSCPAALSPQHWTRPASESAHECCDPSATAFVVPAKPTTCWGTELTEFDPSPSWPNAFAPQHFTPPDVTTAQVWSPPAAIATAPLVGPTTPTAAISFGSPGWPSWP